MSSLELFRQLAKIIFSCKNQAELKDQTCVLYKMSNFIFYINECYAPKINKENKTDG